ncbi:MAG: hypothetical protein [Bacteriophage sp.]|nr:MAG: hypothetical protein [Bacteriophage sp.]
MKIITMNESLGVIWYSAYNHKYEEVHVVIYGLSKTEWTSREQAQEHFNTCLIHAFSN